MNEDILAQLGAGAPENAESTDEVKVEEKKKTSKAPIDDEVIQAMIANGDNTGGMFTPDEKEVVDKNKKEKLHEDIDDKAKLKTKGDAKPSDKYITEFQKDMQKNPEDYFINTPKGKMSLKEAREKGYDPITHRFRKKTVDSKREEELLSQVNEKDREAIKRMLDPSQLQLAPADAQAMGIKPDSPMIRHGEESSQIPQGNPEQQGPMPAQPAGNQPDIMSLLGGNA